MKLQTIGRRLLRSAVLIGAAAVGLSAFASSTYSTYKDDTDTPTDGAYANTDRQAFQLNATWMFNISGDDIASTKTAVALDSIKVYWHSSGHNNADIGKASGTQPDAYLVLTTPQNVVVGISAVNDAAWSAGGSSTFAFTDTLISPNAQYYFYFATDVSSVQVGGTYSTGAQARITGAWHGSSKTADTTVQIKGDNRYSVRCDFAVSETTAYTSIETTAEGVSLATGTDPVFVTGAVAGGVVNVASGASVPSLTVVGEATTFVLADTLTADYLYLPAATTIDATGVSLALPGEGETTAATTLVVGAVSAATTPTVSLPTLAAGYDYASTTIGDGVTVTVSKSAAATLTLTEESVNWSDVKPAGWVDSSVSTITVNYTGACTLVFDEDVQAASIAPDGTGTLVLERGTDVTVSIAAVAIDANAAAMDITFKNFTAIPTYSPYYTAGSDIVRADGTETLTSHPLISTDSAAGTFYFTQPATMDAFTLFGNKTVYFNTGTTGTFGRFVLGNTGSRTQTVTQNDGTITVTGSAAPTSNQASILLGHYSGNVTLNTVGGTFNALNAATRLGWDGTATWAIGGGTSAAEANVLGIVNGENGHTGIGTLNIHANGTLNLGASGIAFSNSSNGGVINFAGGTIKANADTTIANAKAGGTILNQNKTTTLNTDEYTVTLSAPMSGAGVLKKEGSGTLKVTGAGTSTGRHEIDGGTLLLSGNGATLGTGGFNMKGAGAHLDIEPGEGNTITLAADYLINSTSGNSSPVLNINAGTVENNCTGVSQYGQFGQSTVNINDGAEFKLNNPKQLGWNMFTALNVNSGGTLTIAAAQQLTRQLKLNGGTVKLTGVDIPLEVTGNRTVTATADSSIVAEATETAANPAIVVSNGTFTVSVDSAKTLTLAVPIVDGADSTTIAQPVTKAGAGTLKLTAASTSTGALTVSAGTLELDGGSWAGAVTVAQGATLNVVNSAAVAEGALLAAGSFTVNGAVTENGVAVNIEVKSDGIYKATSVEITVPAVANATVSVTVGGETVSPTTEGGTTYSVPAGATVTVTYTAAEGYKLSGTSVYTIASAASGSTIDVSGTSVAAIAATADDGSTFTSVSDALTYAYMTAAIEVVTVLDSTWTDNGDYAEYFTWDSTERKYTKKPFIARIGAVSFTSLAAAVAYTEVENPIIVMLSDTTLDAEVSIAAGKTLTLDLNGCTVTGASGDVAVFGLGSGASVTVQDTSADADGKLYSPASKVFLSGSACTLTLASGTIESGSDLPVYLYDSPNTVVNVTGGKVVSGKSSTSDYAITVTSGTVNISGGEISAPSASVAYSVYLHITGGTFTYGGNLYNLEAVDTLTGGTFNHDVTSLCSSGYKAYEDTTGVWTVSAIRSYTVTFDVDGDTTSIAPQPVVDGGTAIKPTDPEKEDYTFAGWTLGGVAYDFTTPVTGDITLVASWTENTSGGIDPTVDGSTQTVTPTQEQITEAGDAETAAIELATVTVPDAVSQYVTEQAYKGYFKFTATAGENGAYDVAIAGFADEVKADVDGSVLTQVLAAESSATSVTVAVKPGLYYGFAVGSSLSDVGGEPATTLATGTSAMVAKPAAGNTGFIKVRVSTTALDAVE